MIALLDIFVTVIAILIVALFTTQVLIPFIMGTPFFPQFRKLTPMRAEVAAAEKELTEKTELVLLQEQLDELNRRKAELEGKNVSHT